MSTCVHSSRARTLQTDDRQVSSEILHAVRKAFDSTGNWLVPFFFKKKKERKELSPLQVKKYATEWGSHAFEL
jgi:hypothetical protein